VFGDLSTFGWDVPLSPDAFRIEECVSQGKPAPALVWQEDGPVRHYWPLAGKESLYRILAAVSPTPEGIVDFARQYGRLGEGVETYSTLPDGSYATVEPLAGWRTTIGWLGEAVRLWDLAQQSDSAELSKVIRWDKKGVVRYQAPRDLLIRVFGSLPPPELRSIIESMIEEKHVIASTVHNPKRFAAFAQGDVVEPARCVVLSLVNDCLSRTAQPALLWDVKARRVLLRHYPRSLLGAVSLQFATAILSGRTTQTCPVCGRYFEVTALASRNDRLTCSNRCRVRAYRDRQQKARELHGKGWSFKRISKELGSDVSTIKQWLSHHKE
jgi:hypothetical protein